MKIGIITVHRAYNYGSVLQCYALQEYLKSLGHDVWVIDYRQRWVENVDRTFSIYYVWHFVKRFDLHAIVGYWRNRKARKQLSGRMEEVFGSFVKRFKLTSSCRHRIPKGFDVYMIGSDQLWSHQCIGGEDKIYLGFFKRPSKSRLVGFSLSVSSVSLDMYGRKNLIGIISNFNRISMREQLNSDKIYDLTGIRLPVTVDPVLLTDASTWNSMINPQWSNTKYVAIYQVRHLCGQEKLIYSKALLLSKKLNCTIIDLSDRTYSVEDFISIIKYAQCVISSSFHAIVFSLIMKTPCYAVKLNDGLDVRYVDLLTKLGLSKELVDVNFEPEVLEIDFDEVDKRLAYYRQTSIDYINSI